MLLSFKMILKEWRLKIQQFFASFLLLNLHNVLTAYYDSSRNQIVPLSVPNDSSNSKAEYIIALPFHSSCDMVLWECNSNFTTIFNIKS